jgi:hypothetical protein
MANDGQMATDVGHWTHEAWVTSLAGASCCVEARWRSGALNTAHHAETIALAAALGSIRPPDGLLAGTGSLDGMRGLPRPDIQSLTASA